MTDEVQPSIEQLKEWADRLLAITKRFATGPNTAKPPILYPRLVEAAFRRNYTTLATIRYLSDGRPEEVTAFGNSCMDLSRRIFEDMISLEYMKIGDKDKLAKKFWDYLKVQDKLDLDYLKAAGIETDPKSVKIIEENFEKVKKDFLDKTNKSRWNTWKELSEYLRSEGCDIDMVKLEAEFDKRYKTLEDKVRKNWSGMDVEAMIVQLVKAGKVASNEEERSLLQGYSVGNDKNHTSPRDLITFLKNDRYEKRGAGDMNLSLLSATLYLTKMAGVFIEEFDIPDEVAKEIESLWQELLNAHLPKK